MNLMINESSSLQRICAIFAPFDKKISDTFKYFELLLDSFLPLICLLTH